MQQRSPAVMKDVFDKAVGFTKADEFRRAGLYPYFTEFSSGADSGGNGTRIRRASPCIRFQ